MASARIIRRSMTAGVVCIASSVWAQSAAPPWEQMDYGPFLSTAVGIGEGITPVPKGLVVRLRTRDGRPTDLHAVFDTDLLAWRCVWSGTLARRGIVFDGPHGVFPEIEGDAIFRLPPRPGIADPATHAWPPADPRVEPWGPIPPAWGRWVGLSLDGDDVVFEYTVDRDRHRVRERVWAQPHAGGHAFVREINVETSDDTSGAGPILALVASDDRARVVASPEAQLVHAATAIRAPARGTVRVAIAAEARAPGAGAGPAPPAAARRSVDEATAHAAARWGASITTRGVIDDRPGESRDRRRIKRDAGAPATVVTLATAGNGRLELVRDGVVVGAGAAGAVVTLRYPAATPSFTPRYPIGWWPADSGDGSHEWNAFTERRDLRLDGVTWRRGVRGRSLDFDGTAAAWLDDVEIDFAQDDLTIAAWIHTTSDGTVFAVAPRDGIWAPDGVTLFLRAGRLSFDVGWVGVLTAGPRLDDGRWHHVAATWAHADGRVRLYVDGEDVGSKLLPLKNADRDEFVPRFGWTNRDFPATPRFSGYMDGPMLLRAVVDEADIRAIAAMTGEPLVTATVVRGRGDAGDEPATIALAGADAARQARLHLPAATAESVHTVEERHGPRSAVLAWAHAALAEDDAPSRPFRIDRLTWPADNRYGSWLRFGAFDFVPASAASPTSAVITTWSGDVWRVDGLDDDLDSLRWSRVATGLNQPFGVVAQGNGTLVLGRDQITRLHDRNHDGEADFYECFTNAARNSEHFHEPASGLLVTPDGDYLYHKAARHAKLALHDHHGTVLRVSADGSTTEVVARGFRAPIGLTRLPDGALLGSDQEGHWTPANRINLIRPSAVSPPFYGNGWAATPAGSPRVERSGESVRSAWDGDDPYVPPLCWLHPTFDRSPSSQVYVDHPAWGPLAGSILGLSYGTGEVYLVLRDDVAMADGSTVTQGGVVKLGIQLPTGLLAGRIHPASGDLYVCGLFGWSSDRTEPGGFYRVRPMAASWSRSLNIPRRVRATRDGLELTFLHPLDPASATSPDGWTVTAWNYRRNASYGSPTFDLEGRRDARTTWNVVNATLAADDRTVRLQLDGFEPAMQVHVTWSIDDASGRRLEHETQLTVHTRPVP